MMDLKAEHQSEHGGSGGDETGPDKLPLAASRPFDRDHVRRRRRRGDIPGGAGFVEASGQPVPGLVRRAVELGGDAIPQTGGRRSTGVGQEPNYFVVLRHFDGATHAPLEVRLDDGGDLGFHGVERVGTQQLFDLLVAHLRRRHAHSSDPAGSMPRSIRFTRRRPRPDRIRLLTVPSGSFNKVATSR